MWEGTRACISSLSGLRHALFVSFDVVKSTRLEFSQDEDPRPGTRIDDFTIAYRIRRGMNADIFAVWHHALRTPLVCKRLRCVDASNAKWRRLLRAEGAALARLCHPGIVRLIRQQPDGPLPYLLLEHVGEQTLRDMLIDEGFFVVDRAVRIVQHTGAALAHAHARGFIHRDVKPSNIILREGRPVLLDFGVVWKWTQARRPLDQSGTPQYLAPEQVRRESLGPFTDVYGLGVLLFELLTGTRPFRVGTNRHDREAPLALRYPQLIEPLPSLRKAAQRVGQEVSLRLERIVKRCLAANPATRFQSVTELLDALDPFTRIKVWPQGVKRKGCKFSPFT